MKSVFYLWSSLCLFFPKPTHLADFNQVQTIQYSNSEDKDRKGMLQLRIAGAPEVGRPACCVGAGAEDTQNQAVFWTRVVFTGRPQPNFPFCRKHHITILTITCPQEQNGKHLKTN